MRRRFASVLAGLSLALGLSGAAAAEVVLTFATVSPAGLPLNERFLHPWAAAINEDGKGIIRLDVRDGYALANPGNAPNRVLEGVIDIAYTIQTAIGGQFPRTEVVSQPMLSDKSADSAVALWRLYETGLLDEEYADFQPLVLAGLTQASLHFATPLANPDDLDGRRVVVFNRSQAELIEALGGSPQSVPITDSYEALRRGTVDGISIAWTAFPTFRFDEVTSYHLRTRAGTTGAMVFMSKRKWESLPEAARDVLSRHMGEAPSRAFGEYWDAADLRNRATAEGDAKHTVVELSAEQNARWEAIAAPLIGNWVERTPDGETILETYRNFLDDVRNGR